MGAVLENPGPLRNVGEGGDSYARQGGHVIGWPSIADAMAKITEINRPGQVISVNEGGKSVEYWWPDVASATGNPVPYSEPGPVVEVSGGVGIEGLHVIYSLDEDEENTYGFYQADAYYVGPDGVFRDASLVTEGLADHLQKKLYTIVGSDVFSNARMGFPQTLGDLVDANGLNYNNSLFYQELRKATPNFCYVVDIANSPDYVEGKGYYQRSAAVSYIRLPQAQNAAYDGLRVYTFYNGYIEDGSEYGLPVNNAADLYLGGQLKPELSAINNIAHISKTDGTDYVTGEALAPERHLRWREEKDGSTDYTLNWKRVTGKPRINRIPANVEGDYEIFYNDRFFIDTKPEVELVIENGQRYIRIYQFQYWVGFNSGLAKEGGDFPYTLASQGHHKAILIYFNPGQDGEADNTNLPISVVATQEVPKTEPLFLPGIQDRELFLGYVLVGDGTASSGGTGTSEPGTPGKSAYQLAVDAGYPGTLTQWLASLEGSDGQDGNNGQDGESAYDLAVSLGYPGTLAQWLDTLKGPKGEDAPAFTIIEIDQVAPGVPDVRITSQDQYNLWMMANRCCDGDTTPPTPETFTGAWEYRKVCVLVEETTTPPTAKPSISFEFYIQELETANSIEVALRLKCTPAPTTSFNVPLTISNIYGTEPRLINLPTTIGQGFMEFLFSIAKDQSGKTSTATFQQAVGEFENYILSSPESVSLYIPGLNENV